MAGGATPQAPSPVGQGTKAPAKPQLLVLGGRTEVFGAVGRSGCAAVPSANRREGIRDFCWNSMEKQPCSPEAGKWPCWRHSGRASSDHSLIGEHPLNPADACKARRGQVEGRNTSEENGTQDLEASWQGAHWAASPGPSGWPGGSTEVGHGHSANTTAIRRAGRTHPIAGGCHLHPPRLWPQKKAEGQQARGCSPPWPLDLSTTLGQLILPRPTAVRRAVCILWG